MKISALGRHALGVGAAVATLSGCGEPHAPAVVLPQSSAISHPADIQKSWMLPEAKGEDLLYVSSLVYFEYVYVFSYPNGKLVGTLAGFSGAQGLCSDKKGDVYVTDLGANAISEYAHGGTSPVATLDDRAPEGCSVDPAPGDLAVVAGIPYDVEANVAIFPNAKVPPTVYNDVNAPGFDFCTYDNKGNLFVNENGGELTRLALDELPRGSSVFTRVEIAQDILSGGAVQWFGGRLALGDPPTDFGRFGPTIIYLVKIQSLGYGRVMNAVELSSGKNSRNPGTPVQFWIQGNTIVNPVRYDRGVGLWPFPAGGKLEKYLRGVKVPYGVTVSVARH